MQVKSKKPRHETTRTDGDLIFTYSKLREAVQYVLVSARASLTPTYKSPSIMIPDTLYIQRAPGAPVRGSVPSFAPV